MILCACSSDKVKMKINRNEYETNSQMVSLEIPSFEKLGEKEFSDEISSDYEKFSADLLNSFISDSDATTDKRSGKSRLEMKQEEKYNKNGLYSMISEIFEYTHGAYGVSQRRILNVDVNSSKLLLLKDFFSDDAYVDMLNSKLEKISKEAMYSDLWEKPTIGEEQNEYFYFDDKGYL